MVGGGDRFPGQPVHRDRPDGMLHQRLPGHYDLESQSARPETILDVHTVNEEFFAKWPDRLVARAWNEAPRRDGRFDFPPGRVVIRTPTQKQLAADRIPVVRPDKGEPLLLGKRFVYSRQRFDDVVSDDRILI